MREPIACGRRGICRRLCLRILLLLVALSKERGRIRIKRAGAVLRRLPILRSLRILGILRICRSLLRIPALIDHRPRRLREGSVSLCDGIAGSLLLLRFERLIRYVLRLRIRMRRAASAERDGRYGRWRRRRRWRRWRSCHTAFPPCFPSHFPMYKGSAPPVRFPLRAKRRTYKRDCPTPAAIPFSSACISSAGAF